MSSGASEQQPAGTPKSEATRRSILDGAKASFAAKGYSGTTVADITQQSRVTRAGFYYYFRDKRELFLELGAETYRMTVRVAGSLSEVPEAASEQDIRSWVDAWFDYLDDHGAYLVRSAEDAPTDADFRAAVNHLQRRTARLLGEEVGRRSSADLGDPVAMGLALMAMLERSWLLQQMPAYPARRAQMVDAATSVILALLR